MKIRADVTGKPYYKCLTCPRFRKECGGFPTRDMSLKEWCEYLRDVKDFFGLTNAEVVKSADVSAATVERVMACTLEQDIMRGTERRLEIAVLGSAGYKGCLLEYDLLRANLEAQRLEYIELERKMDFLLAENNRKAKIIDHFLEAK